MKITPTEPFLHTVVPTTMGPDHNDHNRNCKLHKSMYLRNHLPITYKIPYTCFLTMLLYENGFWCATYSRSHEYKFCQLIGLEHHISPDTIHVHVHA